MKLLENKTQQPISSRSKAILNLSVIGLVVLGVVGIISVLPSSQAKAEAKALVTLATGKTIVLGDSYASGEGNAPYRAGTDEPAPGNRCHVSTISNFGNIVSNGNADIVACSGATTNNLLSNGQYGQAPQIDQIPADTDNVVVIVGANDIDLAGAATGCVFLPNCVTFGKASMQQNLDKLQPKLEQVFNKIALAAPEARVFVVNYPVIFPENRSVAACLWGVNTTEQAWLRSANLGLNQKIAAAYRAVDQAHPDQFTLVDTVPQFVNHEICGSQFNYVAGMGEGVLHPNFFGHLVLSQTLSEAAAH
jgi:lysophospholipase L1-like esterase